MSAVSSASSIPVNHCECSYKGICPTDVLKSLDSLDVMENYLYGNKDFSFKYNVTDKQGKFVGIQEIRCVGFKLNPEILEIKGVKSKIFEILEPQDYFGRTSIQMKSIINQANKILNPGKELRDDVFIPSGGESYEVMINKERQLDEATFAKIQKLFEFITDAKVSS